MSLMGHLEELRRRLILSVLALLVGVSVSFFLSGWIFEILKSRVEGVQLIRTQVTEMIGTYMRVSFISGLALAMPVVVYQLVMFLAPALTPKEKRSLYMMMPGIFLSFIGGAAFAFFVLLPPAMGFLIHFGENIAQPLIRVGDYVSVVTSMMFWVGLSFETPILIFFLARIGLVTPGLLSRYRRYAFVAAFVLAAIITPTVDPINQSLVAIPLIILYEIGILLAKLAWRGRS
ncbi:MAG: Sec-independent protein translocase, TatC subunit [Dehalococcoidia bacterium]|nr:Sec-independent protein translocase, TatC subunit [Dehalococcoidia bacterium]